MSECSKYLDNISAYIDGELDEEQSRELLDHISVCPACSAILDIYREISVVASDPVKAPKELKSAVMNEINGTNGRKSKAGKKVIVLRFLSAAACFALVIFASVSLFRGGSKDASNGSVMSAETSSGMDSGKSAEPWATSEAGDILLYDNEDFTLSNEADDAEAGTTPAFDEALEDIKNLDFSDYHSIVYVDGELSGELKALEWYVTDESSFFTVVSAELAERVSDSGYAAELYNTEASEAIIIWTP